MKNNKEIAIIGGGASGLFCAIILKQLNKEINVTIYEAQNKVGKKILQTGNGKCNLSNVNITTDNYNTNKISKILNTFDSQQLINILNSWGLMTRTDSEGRIYPYSEKATTVLDVFLEQINNLGIKIQCDTYITDVKYSDKFILSTNNKECYSSDYLIICTGGNASINYIYNTNILVSKFGHQISPLSPSLCALKTKENTKSLSGLRAKCNASIIVDGEKRHTTEGEVLFKDNGLSGIAIFILSQFYEKNKKCVINLDLFPEKTEEQLNRELLNEKSLENNLIGYFSKMINYDIIKRTKNNNVGYTIKNYDFNVIDTYGFNNAQVTKGGVLLDEISLDSFESKKCNNMYIIGEALDVDGTCGGYNLHFAWASAYNAALNIVKKIGE